MTNEQLLKFSRDHLCYEINHLCAAIVLREKHKINPNDGFSVSQDNLLAESMIFHSRAIYEFLFYPTSQNKKHQDDARAFHFFDDQNVWEKIKPIPSTEIKDLCTRAGKELAHLTYERLNLTEVTKKWKLYNIANELLNSLTILSTHANSSKLHKDVKSTLDHWKNLIIFSPTKMGLGSAVGATSAISFQKIGKP